jgi:hypothetical protein
MRFRSAKRGLSFLLLPLVACAGCGRVPQPAPTAEAVQPAIRRAADYLANAVQADGMFTYCINLDPSITVEEEYGMVRHAGTIYAMCMAYPHHPTADSRSAILRAGGYLRGEAIGPVEEGQGMLAVWSDPEVPADHWALLATEKLLALGWNGGETLFRDRLIEHALAIFRPILREQIHHRRKTRYDGGFSEHGRTTYTSTRLEGLLATLAFLPKTHPMAESMSTSAERGISFLLRAQISSGEFSGAMPLAVAPWPGRSDDVAYFNRRSTEVRIDYVQHALSAMVQYAELPDSPAFQSKGP